MTSQCWIRHLQLKNPEPWEGHDSLRQKEKENNFYKENEILIQSESDTTGVVAAP